ncbi:hypothetical protein [Photobacterium indicum]|uniref:hypothetical protein n=1 Tax=Photobacterium indicum TaxID=81447 RepID=UPI003D136A7C
MKIIGGLLLRRKLLTVGNKVRVHSVEKSGGLPTYPQANSDRFNVSIAPLDMWINQRVVVSLSIFQGV